MADRVSRRRFLGWTAMGSGLMACAAMGVHIVFEFLLPKGGSAEPRKMYVGQVDELPPGRSRTFSAPSGERYLLTNTGSGIVAFSATCPHLGCKVHWESADSRFFCPCHHGAFAADGSPTEGPPKDENTPLRALELQIDGGAIFALVS